MLVTEYADFQRFMVAFAITAVRVVAAMELLPALSSSMVTGLGRRAAALAFALLAVPVTLKTMPSVNELSTLYLGVVALKETAIGLLIGFFAAVPFWIAENVGNVIDNQRGATMGEVYSPLSGAQVSTTGIFFTQIVSTIFFVGGAILIFLGAIYKSWAIFPIFSGDLAVASSAATTMLSTVDMVMRTTFIIAAPIIILMFLATIGLGFVNRTAPQLNVFFLSMPIKSALGIAMLIIYLQYIMDMLMYTNDKPILDSLRRVFTGG
ncbi:MAG: type III secretion system export apparatus subunit SctT [Kiritimatiellae bacterium]|nr:type III secretion system export apparatus subunit SctT [Kiritimatiellia bacterium]